MKTYFFLRCLVVIFLSLALPAFSHAGKAQVCSCKCVTKDDDGKFVLTHGKGKDREAAGIDVKKNLGKKKCELTPVCEGSC